ncbi:MAG TPA: orotate phosphoribosyltransferase [Verrucomicrobiae bacterium]|nr:orotate phosphoribosyltransferase [Verrucomicrobiae bacterium]
MGGDRVTDAEVLKIFRDTGALLDGHFLLRSGLHSRQYFQCALVLQYPRIAERLCSALATKLKRVGAQTVISPAMGGLFVGHEVARALDVRHIFAEKNAAGKLELRRNFRIAPREKVLVVEDVVTKGGRVQETIDIVSALGGDIVAVGTLVDRSVAKVDFGAPLESLLRLQAETFDPTACPLCQSGIPLVKPGS